MKKEVIENLKDKFTKKNLVSYIPVIIIRILFLFTIALKTEMFTVLTNICYDEGRKKLFVSAIYLMFTGEHTIFHLMFALGLFSIGYLFTKKGQYIFYFVSNLLMSILAIMDLSYYRANDDFLGFKNIFYPGTFNITGRQIFYSNKYYIAFFYDIIAIIVIVYIGIIIGNLCENRSAINSQENSILLKINNIKKAILSRPKFGILRFISIIICISIVISVKSNKIVVPDTRTYRGIFTKSWNVEDTVSYAGVVGYHYIEGYNLLKDGINGIITKEDKKKVKNWIDYNREDIPDNEYRGVLRNKNVIIIQVESLENFVINKKTNGKEITPFLNKLSKESIYFSSIYQQNNAASSIDCDFMVNTSIFPLGGNTITAIAHSQNTYKNSLPRVLKSEGYNTSTAHAEITGNFSWGETHKNSFGVDNIYDVNTFSVKEVVGYGISDKCLYPQVAEKLASTKKPFLYQFATLSSHGPFNIDKKYRTLNLPKEIDESYLGGYFESINYADRQLENFFNILGSNRLLDDSVVVILGDHTGVHKYYNDEIQNLDYEDGWWKDQDYKIPMFIYANGINPKEVIASGGQVDLLPTLLYMMGVDKDKYENTSMGRNLINTNRDATIRPDGTIYGEPKDEEEIAHLKEAYEIGSIIINKNYYK